MQDNPTMFFFEIQARADIDAKYLPTATGKAAINKSDSNESESNESEHGLIAKLNGNAAEICDKLEREIKKSFPPYITVQADVHFEAGSLLMTGTVAILSWIGGTALDALKDQAQEQLSALVKMAVQRVMNRVVTASGYQAALGPMDMSVLPARFPQRTGSVVPGQPALASPPEPVPPVSTEARRRANANESALGAAPWLSWAVAIVFILQVLLVLDRLLVVQLR